MLAQELGGEDGGTDRPRPLLRDALRAGRLVLLLAGLADVDRHGGFLDGAQAAGLLHALDALAARRVVLLARGSAAGGRM